MYDPRCEELARLFLGDACDSDAKLEHFAPLLAQEIQDVIEAFISIDVERPGPSDTPATKKT